MALEWKRVTWYSQVAAIVLFVGIFFLGFWLGEQAEQASLMQAVTSMPATP